MRFRKRVKVAPGVHLNIGKSGVSTSVGVRGANVTIGKKTTTTLGMPGTGLSHSVTSGQATPARQPATVFGSTLLHTLTVGLVVGFFMLVLAIFSGGDKPKRRRKSADYF